MSENTKLWDILGRTDPKHVKKFKRAGGFEGTAIKPMWSYLRLTEEFGPCGTGWGVGEPTFQVVPGDNREILVFCTVSAWYVHEEAKRYVHGVGGDKIVTHIKANPKYDSSERWQNDDEAFKKSFTDAITNAFKFVGVGADVHMGLFDDNKYVDSMREEFSEPEPVKAKRVVGIRDDGTRTSFALKNDKAWEKLTFELSVDLGDCHTLLSLEKIKTIYRKRAQDENWNRSYTGALKEVFDGFEAELRAKAETEAAALDASQNGNGATILSGG